jgi:hypothetical protein
VELVRRETIADVFANHLIPSRLSAIAPRHAASGTVLEWGAVGLREAQCLVSRALLLLGIANSAPILAKCLLGERLGMPLDAGLIMPDGSASTGEMWPWDWLSSPGSRSSLPEHVRFEIVLQSQALLDMDTPEAWD